jgi:hypothetical protein
LRSSEEIRDQYQRLVEEEEDQYQRGVEDDEEGRRMRKLGLLGLLGLFEAKAYSKQKAMNEVDGGRDRATPASVRHDDEEEVNRQGRS